jgi:putative membrane protein
MELRPSADVDRELARAVRVEAARIAPERSLRYPAALLGLYGVFWLALAIRPIYRQDWLLENVLVFAAVPVLVATFRRLRFSDLAYTALFAFFVLHAVGAHYTYSEVPYDRAFEALAGRSLHDLLGWQRNHYDRLVHFSYGLLVMPAAVELYAAVAPPRGAWKAVLPLLFVCSHSLLYELIEWAAAVAFGGDLGAAYLGTQGDPWDAQKDMALATLGAVVSLALLAAREAALRRHVAPGRHAGPGRHAVTP